MRRWALAVLAVYLAAGLAALGGYAEERAILLGPFSHAGPSMQHWFGTNALGQDLFARWIQACGGLLSVVLPAAVLAWALGVLLGVLAALDADGPWDYAIARLVDGFEVVPGYLWLLFGALLLQRQPGAGIGLLVLCFWAEAVRPLRQVGAQCWRSPALDAARTLGYGPLRSCALHLMPQLAPLLRAQALSILIGCIQAEALLGFLGLLPHARISLGGLLAEGSAALFAGQLWPMLLGSIALFLPIHALGVLSLSRAPRTSVGGDAGSTTEVKVSVLLRALLYVLISALLISGCRPARVTQLEREAPSVQILDLTAEPDQAIAVRLLLRNFLDRPLRVVRLDYRLTIDGSNVAQGSFDPELRLGARSSDSTQIRLPESSALLQAMQSLRARGQGRYELSGVLEAIEPSRRIEYRYQGSLSLTPGTEHSFR